MKPDLITWRMSLLLLLLSPSHALKLQQQTSASSMTSVTSVTVFDFADESLSDDNLSDDNSSDYNSSDDSSSSVRHPSQLYSTAAVDARSRRSAEQPYISADGNQRAPKEQRASLLPGFPDPAKVAEILQAVGEKVIPQLVQGNSVDSDF